MNLQLVDHGDTTCGGVVQSVALPPAGQMRGGLATHSYGVYFEESRRVLSASAPEKYAVGDIVCLQAVIRSQRVVSYNVFTK